MMASFVQKFLMRFRSPETTARKLAAEALYAAVVRMARQPRLFVEFAIPDSFDGRFDCLVLFASLILRRLKQLEGDRSPLGREFATLFISDMDRTVREMGVGDLGVGKHVKTMAQAFYGRLRAYDRALSGEESLRDALQRNLFAGAEIESDRLLALESHVLYLVARLDEMTWAEFTSGEKNILELLLENRAEKIA